MTLPNNGTTANYGNGWLCGSCGSWVPNGTSHICNWPYQPPPIPTTGFIATVPIHNSYAILTELREIKELLKERLHNDG